jgi:transcription termination factor NusA
VDAKAIKAAQDAEAKAAKKAKEERSKPKSKAKLLKAEKAAETPAAAAPAAKGGSTKTAGGSDGNGNIDKALQAAASLKGQAGAVQAVKKILADQGVNTLDDLADMTVDELADAGCLTPADARAVIVRAREDWFSPDGAVKTPASAPAAAKKTSKAKPAENQLGLELPSAGTLSPQPAWPFPTLAKAPVREAAAGKAASAGKDKAAVAA